MGLFSVIVPEETKNRVYNPSFEENITDSWSVYKSGAATGTRTQSSTQSRFGYESLLIDKTGGAAGDDYGLRCDNLGTSTSGSSYVATAWAYLENTGTRAVLLLQKNTGTGAVQQATAGTSTTDEWVQLEADALTANATGDALYAYIYINDGVSKQVYFDAVQIEAKSYATTYCDGDQEGCEWDAAEHNGLSTRSERSMAGGREVNLDDYDFYVTNVQGAGVPPHYLNTQPYALLPGAGYQSTKINPALLQLSGVVKGGTLETMHDNRKSLIDAFAPDGLKSAQPVRVRYSGGTTTKEIKTFYEGGLEFGGTIKPDDDAAVLRLIAFDPFWYEIGENAAALDHTDGLATPSLIGHIDGAWNNMGNPNVSTTTILATTYAVAVGNSKEVYFGGDWINLDGDANADYIAYWDGTSWNAMGSGASGNVYAIAVRPDGTVYAGGDFSSMGGVADTSRIAYWNGAAWSAMGTGATDDVRQVTIGPDGTVYAVGSFTDMSGVADTNRIAAWDGSNWSAMGTGMNGATFAVVCDNDGNVYAGGNFTTAGETAANRVAKWTSSGGWEALGDGLDAGVWALAIAPDSTLYAGGAFLGLQGGSTGTHRHVAKWNGTTWDALGEGLGGVGGVNESGMAVAPDGTLFVCGDNLYNVDPAPPGNIVRWNGYSWSGVFHTQSGGVEAIGIGPADPVTDRLYNLYVGLVGTSASTASGNTTITNDGSAVAHPVIEITSTSNSSNTFYGIRSETNGMAIMSAYTVIDSEKLTIDTRPGTLGARSSFFGSRPAAVLENSDLAAFVLEPGDNLVSVFGEANLTVKIRWKTAYKGFDD